MTPPRTAPAGWGGRGRSGGRAGSSFCWAGGRGGGGPWSRRWGSEGTSLACRALLGVPVHDVTGGFKCWRRQVLETLPLEEVRSRGFAFQIELNYICWRGGDSLAGGAG